MTLTATKAAPRRTAQPPLVIRPFDAPLGAEVIGRSVGAAVAEGERHGETDDAFDRIHRAHLDHHVLVFRNQRITPDDQVAFSRRFGPLQIHVLHQFQLPGHPEVLVVSNIRDDSGKPIGLGDAGAYWHSDLSYKERPSLGSMLHAQELPAEGGDTLFANMHRAWDTLPTALKTAIDGLRAEHSYLNKYDELRERTGARPPLSAAQLAEVRPVVHPVVRIHPDTGRKALFVSEHFTTRIVVPSALPSILSGLRIGWAFAWRTLIAAELVFGASSGTGGLGWYIFQARNELYTDKVFAGLATVVLVGLVVDGLVFDTLERLTVRRWGMER